MFLFPFYKKNNYTLKKLDNDVLLQHNEHKTQYLLKPYDVDANFYVLTTDEKGKYNINNKNYTIKKAKMCYTALKAAEDEKIKHEETNYTIETLIDSFGNKKAKKIYKSYKDQEKRKPEQKIIYTYEEQIVPTYNINAKEVKDIYTLEDIFGSDVINEIKKTDIKSQNLHESIQEKYDETYMLEFVLLDCIVKFLERRKIFVLHLGTIFIVNIEALNNFFATFVENKFCTDKSKDKLAMIAYVLLLKINNYKIKYDDVIKLRYEKSKIVAMFKSLGCTYNDNSGNFSLTKAPAAEILQKRRKITK
ncbi:hypothetical protein BDAP_001377 [Binucleata daphniae]